MRFLHTLSLLILALVLTGCNIKVVVSEGGVVSTLSGNYSCGSGQTCDVFVTDTNFDETFVAEPNPGFIFVGWKKRPAGFCGGTSGDCRLFTTLFAGNAVFEALLDGTTVYYMEAEFAEPVDDDGPIVGGSATACFNEALLQPGSRFEAIYDQELLRQTAEDFFVDGAAVFEGMDVLQSTREVESLAPGFSSTSVTRQFYTVDTSGPVVTTVGGEVETFTGSSTIISRTVYEPGLQSRFDLQPGEPFSQTVVATTTQSLGGQETSVSAELEITGTYVGRQVITVPAGTFEACRYESVTISRVEGQPEFVSENTQWLAVGSGVTLRVRAEGLDFQVLVEGTLNGVSL
ncbi:MAG: hypothetical protein QNI86_11565 [Halieaceae bacterium]|nr:hypothetical protein [Halieaceae bacterium]